MSKVTSCEAILTVPSVEETIRWYEGVLGLSGQADVFAEDGRALFGCIWSGVEETPVINISRYGYDSGNYSNKNSNFNALIYVDDVDQMYERVLSSGWKTDSAVTDEVWGGRVFQMTDLNGFRLTIAQLVDHVDETLAEVAKVENNSLSAT